MKINLTNNRRLETQLPEGENFWGFLFTIISLIIIFLIFLFGGL